MHLFASCLFSKPLVIGQFIAFLKAITWKSTCCLFFALATVFMIHYYLSSRLLKKHKNEISVIAKSESQKVTSKSESNSTLMSFMDELSNNEDDCTECSIIQSDLSTSFSSSEAETIESSSETIISDLSISSDEDQNKLSLPTHKQLIYQESFLNATALNASQDPVYEPPFLSVPTARERDESLRLLRECQSIQISKIIQKRKNLKNKRSKSTINSYYPNQPYPNGNYVFSSFYNANATSQRKKTDMRSYSNNYHFLNP